MVDLILRRASREPKIPTRRDNENISLSEELSMEFKMVFEPFILLNILSGACNRPVVQGASSKEH